jgi:hypothetical protein
MVGRHNNLKKRLQERATMFGKAAGYPLAEGFHRVEIAF